MLLLRSFEEFRRGGEKKCSWALKAIRSASCERLFSNATWRFLSAIKICFALGIVFYTFRSAFRQRNEDEESENLQQSRNRAGKKNIKRKDFTERFEY